MKRLLSIVLSLVLTTTVLSTAVAAAAEETVQSETSIHFSDVDKDTVAGKAIYKLVDAGILVGDGNGKFRPDDPISRGELTKIVNALFHYTQKDTTGFSDVTPANWYYDCVLIAKKAGYILGYDDGTFRGNARVTREQACAILCRVANLFSVSPDVTINDAVSPWAMPYVQKVLGNMFMRLENGGTFRAQQNITRAEFSVVYANFLQELPDEEENDDQPSEGGETGGSSGGSGGGSGGGSDVNYQEVNRDMLANLKTVSNDIANNINVFTTEPSAMLIYTVKECIQKVIADGASNVIDKGYLVRNYGADIRTAKGYFNQIKADPALKAKFSDEISYLKVETIEWLLDAFDIDTSQLTD